MVGETMVVAFLHLSSSSFLYLRSLFFFFSSYEADASFICEGIRKESRIPFSNSFFGIKFALFMIETNLFIFGANYILSC